VSARLARALGVEKIDIDGPVRVDDVDRRYRDAIKAGARGVHPPMDDPDGARVARIALPEGGREIEIRSGE